MDIVCHIRWFCPEKAPTLCFLQFSLVRPQWNHTSPTDFLKSVPKVPNLVKNKLGPSPQQSRNRKRSKIKKFGFNRQIIKNCKKLRQECWSEKALIKSYESLKLPLMTSSIQSIVDETAISREVLILIASFIALKWSESNF